MILRVREEVNLLHENGPQLTLAREDMEQVGINSITVAEQRWRSAPKSTVSLCLFSWLFPWLPVGQVSLHCVAVMPRPW